MNMLDNIGNIANGFIDTATSYIFKSDKNAEEAFRQKVAAQAVKIHSLSEKTKTLLEITVVIHPLKMFASSAREPVSNNSGETSNITSFASLVQDLNRFRSPSPRPQSPHVLNANSNDSADADSSFCFFEIDV